VAVGDPERFAGSEVKLSVDPSALGEASSPTGAFSGTVTFDSPDATGGPIVIPVTATVLSGSIDAHWTTPPPTEVQSSHDFPLAFDVSGDVGGFSAFLFSQRVPPPSQFEDSPFQLPVSVTGPGHYALDARGVSCNGADYALALSVRLSNGAATGRVPILPALLTRLLPLPAAFGVFEGALADFRIFAGLSSGSQSVRLATDCRRELRWTATPDVPWIEVTPASGTTRGRDVFISVNPAALGTAPGLYTGHVVFASPDDPAHTPDVPVRVRVD
jgi:hypothetical protein